MRRTGRLLAAEEGGVSLGWGAELVARAVEAGDVPALRARRVAALDLPIANSRALEDATLPQLPDLIAAALALAGRSP